MHVPFIHFNDVTLPRGSSVDLVLNAAVLLAISDWMRDASRPDAVSCCVTRGLASSLRSLHPAAPRWCSENPSVQHVNTSPSGHQLAVLALSSPAGTQTPAPSKSVGRRTGMAKSVHGYPRGLHDQHCSAPLTGSWVEFRHEAACHANTPNPWQTFITSRTLETSNTLASNCSTRSLTRLTMKGTTTPIPTIRRCLATVPVIGVNRTFSEDLSQRGHSSTMCVHNTHRNQPTTAQT